MPGPPRRTISTRQAALVLLVAGVLAYANSFRGVYLYDDLSSVADNVHTARLWPITEALSVPLWNTGSTFDGRPVLSLTFALNRALLGHAPWSYHVGNLLVHILNGVLLFAIVRRTIRGQGSGVRGQGGETDRRSSRQGSRQSLGDPGATGVALVVALLWLVHPLNTSSVTYIVQRAESLLGFWILLMLYCAIRGFQSDTSDTSDKSDKSDKSDRAWYGAAILSCVLGAASKEVMIVAPFLVAAYDHVFVQGSVRAKLRQRWVFYLLLFVLTWGMLAFLVVSTMKEKAEHLGALSPLAYLLTQPAVILHYLRLAFWPHPLVMTYNWGPPEALGSLLLNAIPVIVLGVLSVYAMLRRHWMGFLGVAAFLVIGPSSSFLPTLETASEHRMYLPMLAVLVPVVLGGAAITGHRRRYGMPLVLVLAVVLGRLTFARNRDYHSAERLWGKNIRHEPDSWQAHINYAFAIEPVKRWGEAERHYRRAIAINPASYLAHNNLGNVLFATGRVKEAMAQYRQALKCNPRGYLAHNNLGNAHFHFGDYDKAMAEYRRALATYPAGHLALNGLGSALLRTRRPREAAEQFRAAIKSKPDYDMPHHNLGEALVALGRKKEARECFREAVRLNPKNYLAFNNMGNTFVAENRLDEAMDCYRRALAIQPDFAFAHNNLGTALTQVGRPADALPHFRAAATRPGYAAAHVNWGDALVALGREDEAALRYAEAARIDPGNALVPYYNLGAYHRKKGQAVRARDFFQKALEIAGKRGDRALMERIRGDLAGLAVP